MAQHKLFIGRSRRFAADVDARIVARRYYAGNIKKEIEINVTIVMMNRPISPMGIMLPSSRAM